MAWLAFFSAMWIGARFHLLLRGCNIPAAQPQSANGISSQFIAFGQRGWQHIGEIRLFAMLGSICFHVTLRLISDNVGWTRLLVGWFPCWSWWCCTSFTGFAKTFLSPILTNSWSWNKDYIQYMMLFIFMRPTVTKCLGKCFSMMWTSTFGSAGLVWCPTTNTSVAPCQDGNFDM